MGSDHPNILTGKTVALCLAVRQVVLHCPALDNDRSSDLEKWVYNLKNSIEDNRK